MATRKFKTKWDLGLLYASDKDPRMAKDMADMRAACERFEKRYKGKTNYLESPAALGKALKEYEDLAKLTSGKPIYYYFYRKDLDATDATAEAMMNKLSLELTELGNKTVFFGVAVSKIPERKQKEFLAAPSLSHYRYYLKTAFEQGKHTLSEPEEKILNLKSLPGYDMWVSYSEKLENVQTIKFQGKDLPLPEAMNMIQNLPTPKRRKLHGLVMEKLKSISAFAEAELNAVYTDKKINDGLRGYKEPYDRTILGYENDREAVLRLIETVTRRFDISHRFYKLKARMLGLPHLEYADRSAKVGDVSKKIPFDEAYSAVHGVFERADGRFGNILKSFMESGQIDVYPKKGKAGGAYCNHGIDMPTFVLLNHVPDFNSLTTFAHEMGHAIHSEMSKAQSPVYQGYTMSAAETASTLFEGLVFEEVFSKLTEKEKIVALHDRIGRDVSTIFRQIACFNFELDLHRAVRGQGSISKEDIAKLLNGHMAAYLGPAVKMSEDDGYFFVTWSHIRRFFYVYSYAYGQIISRAMVRKLKSDPAYISEIKKFLSAGGSASPDDIFRSIGIDTRDPKFFEEGLKEIEEDIERLEKLTAKK